VKGGGGVIRMYILYVSYSFPYHCCVFKPPVCAELNQVYDKNVNFLNNIILFSS